jgi:hypothetical protein
MSLRFFTPAALALLPPILLLSCGFASSPVPYIPYSAPTRGLLASRGLEGQPTKAVYFFPGERGTNQNLYTTHPDDARDTEWNSDPSTRGWVMDRMVRAHVNTVVMSYWSDMPGDSPMALDGTSLPGVLDAIGGRPLVVLPAIESGTVWSFADEFPTDAEGKVAPGLVDRIGDMVTLFRGRMHLWAKMYDLDGTPRYAVNIVHAYSTRLFRSPFDPRVDLAFARGFDAVAAEVERRFGLRVGFTLDPIQSAPYWAEPDATGPVLAGTPSVLAIQSFEPEVWSGVVESSAPCPPGSTCAPYDNNVDNLGSIADWKLQDTRAWASSGVPVILSVSNGFDGRYVWEADGSGIWGDNHDSTDDRFRNWVSEMKGPGIQGITFDTWNGYTEGYAAVRSTEHGDTVYDWLSDLLKPDPRKCDHVHYESGVRTHRVFGKICRKWLLLGGDRGYGAPSTDVLRTDHGRVSHFEGGSIYWSRTTHAHEVHGEIDLTYREAGAGASCLGLPVHDEQSFAGGSMSRFEHGVIRWYGGARAQIVCRPSG